jgi:hypothetical protein
MHRVAPDGEQDAEFPLPLAVEQNPHFLAKASESGSTGHRLGLDFRVSMQARTPRSQRNAFAVDFDCSAIHPAAAQMSRSATGWMITW